MATSKNGLTVTAEDIEVLLRRLHATRWETDCPSYIEGTRAGRRWGLEHGSIDQLREYASLFQEEEASPGSVVMVAAAPPGRPWVGRFVPPAGVPTVAHSDPQHVRSWSRGWLAGAAAVYEAVRDRAEPEAIIARAECLGLRVQIREGMAALVGDLERAIRQDANLAADFVAVRAEITAELSR